MTLSSPSPMSWPVAVAVAALALAVAALLLALVPHLALNHLTAFGRDGRVAVVTLYEPLAFVTVAWGAVRLQRRGAR